MSIRSFATGMLTGLVIPAVILLIVMMTDGKTTAAQTNATPTRATAAAIQTTIPSPTKTTTPTKTPSQTAGPTTTATTQTMPQPTLTPTPTRQPVLQSTPTKTAGVDPTDYQVKRVDVAAGRMVYMVFTLPEKSALEGSVEISGGDGKVVLWATEHSGTNVIAKKEVTDQGEFSIPATKAGQYTLYLDNSKSVSTSRQVTIYYRLRP